MVWTYLAESEDSQLPYQNGLHQSPIVKSTPTLEPYYFQECQKVNCRLPRFGTTLKLSEASSYQKLISSTADSHAKTLALLTQMEKAWQESEADYFQKSCDSQMSLNLPSCSSKTSPILEIEAWIQSLKKLPLEGMIVDGVYYPLPKLERHTLEKDGGYWATPTATEYGSNQGGSQGRVGKVRPSLSTIAKLFPTPDAHNRGGRKNQNGHQFTLQDYVKKFPTPTVQDFKRRGPNSKQQGLSNYVTNYPTPKTRDWKDNGKSPAEFRRNTLTLATVAGGQLSPMWVEWLMGYPIGWTELKDWATQLCQRKQKKRLNIYGV